jgi:hypothetical protein
MCAHSYFRGLRRYREIEQAAAERGRIKDPDLLIFTNDEKDEIGLIKGQFVADAVRILHDRVEQV